MQRIAYMLHVMQFTQTSPARSVSSAPVVTEAKAVMLRTGPNIPQFIIWEPEDCEVRRVEWSSHLTCESGTDATSRRDTESPHSALRPE